MTFLKWNKEANKIVKKRKIYKKHIKKQKNSNEINITNFFKQKQLKKFKFDTPLKEEIKQKVNKKEENQNKNNRNNNIIKKK